MVVGADVGLDRADPQPAVLAGDVVDQVVQRLGHRRAGDAGEEVVQVARRTSRGPAPGGRWTPTPGRPSPRRRTRRRRRRRGCRRARTPAGRGRPARGRAGRARGRPASGSRPRMPVGRAVLAGGQQAAPRRRQHAVDERSRAGRPRRACAGTGASRSARRGVRQRSRATRSSGASPAPGGYSASTVERRAADRRRGVPDQVGGQRVDRLAGDVALTDQGRQPDAGQPAGGERRPAVGEVLLAPDVVGCGWAATRRGAGRRRRAARRRRRAPAARRRRARRRAARGPAASGRARRRRRCAAARPAPPRGVPSSSPTLPTLSSAAPAARRSTEPCSCG